MIIIASTLALITITSVLVRLFRKHKTLRGRRLPPGPRPWPIVGNIPQLGRKAHVSIAELARVHGPLLHLKMGSVHVVAATTASVAEQFLRVHDTNFLSRPPSSGAKYVAYNYQDMVFGPYGPRWRLLRKMSSQHIFSTKAMEGFRHVRQEEVGNLTHQLASVKGTDPVLIGEMLNACTTNTIARVALGKHGVRHAPKADQLKTMVGELMIIGGIFNLGDFIPFLEPFDLQGVVSKMKKLHARFDSFLTEILQEYKINIDIMGHVDLLSTLISLRDDADDGAEGGKLSDTEIKALLLNLFVAGTETTSITVEWALAEIIRHPKILAQARQELDSIVGKDRFVSESDLTRLAYLQAVVKENFRLHPSTPLSLPRISEDYCEINGYFIPKGSTLLVNIWAISRDPNVWPDPLEFRPERFLPGGEKYNVDVRGNDFELIPFGSGRRVCAGMGLGLRMVQLLTATLIHAFDFDLVDGQLGENLNMEEGYGLSLPRAEPLLVHPKPRLAPHVYQVQP